MYLTFKQWLIDNWYLLPIFLIMVVIVFLLLRLQTSLRDKSAAEIEKLLRTNPELCAERLENNRLFRIVFRKPVIELWKLQAYMQLGQDDKIEKTIDNLMSMSLEPRDKIELYQQALSYYAVVGNKEKALDARTNLRKFIFKAKVQDIEPFSSMLEDADMITGIYVEHNTALIKKLIGKAEHTKDDVSRGVLQYRIAKLAYYKGDTELMETYLSRAEKNLKNTAYEEIIEAAKTNPTILEKK